MLQRSIVRLHKQFSLSIRSAVTTDKSNNGELGSAISLNAYHKESDNTLEDLSEKLESILEDKYDQGADVTLSNGVLTAIIDHENTYVINKQTPNRQLWLSSPLSGPMRFDFIDGRWLEKRSRTELTDILSKELSQLLKNRVNIS